MPDEASIQVNFGKAVPLFPLDNAALLPQQVLHLHVFEPRYRQMVGHALDGAGQFAVAVFKGNQWKHQYHGRPALRPAVCIGQIMEHEKLSDGRYNVLVQGVCRARIVEEEPAAEGRLYRLARVEPVGIDPEEEMKLYGIRERFTELLTDGPLTKLTAAEWIVDRIGNSEIPAAVVLELVGFALSTRRETRYRLLEEGDAGERAEIVERELLDLQKLIRMAAAQHPETWPKGCSWN
ncbi:MAG: LON peptidase substrate-binding domain-containing protein [Phycisphaerales bacterium]|nr:LON peptidase substrate-binding domain-containing protein [Phycisphaerales bacterium]